MPQHTHEPGKYIWCVHNDCIQSTTPMSSWKKLKQHMKGAHNQEYNLKQVISKTIKKRQQQKKKH